MHNCPYCGKENPTSQALGGHIFKVHQNAPAPGRRDRDLPDGEGMLLEGRPYPNTVPPKAHLPPVVLNPNRVFRNTLTNRAWRLDPESEKRIELEYPGIERKKGETQ